MFLDQEEASEADETKTVRGYKVKVQYSVIDKKERKRRLDAIAKVIVGSMKKQKD